MKKSAKKSADLQSRRAFLKGTSLGLAGGLAGVLATHAFPDFNENTELSNAKHHNEVEIDSARRAFQAIKENIFRVSFINKKTKEIRFGHCFAVNLNEHELGSEFSTNKLILVTARHVVDLIKTSGGSFEIVHRVHDENNKRAYGWRFKKGKFFLSQAYDLAVIELDRRRVESHAKKQFTGLEVSVADVELSSNEPLYRVSYRGVQAYANFHTANFHHIGKYEPKNSESWRLKYGVDEDFIHSSDFVTSGSSGSPIVSVHNSKVLVSGVLSANVEVEHGIKRNISTTGSQLMSFLVKSGFVAKQ